MARLERSWGVVIWLVLGGKSGIKSMGLKIRRYKRRYNACGDGE